MVPRGLISGLAMTAVAALLLGCGGSSSPGPINGGGAPRPIPPPNIGPADQCGALRLQHLVGRPRTEIPVPVDVSSRRVTCTECPLTEDYSAGRLNILFDRDTGLVERVYCG
jgi:hypothetical protein